MANPLIPQGTLNRVLTSMIVANFTNLNVISSNMGKTFAKLVFDGNFDEQIETATGIVTSPEPYVMATVTVGILRTQSLASAWLSQSQTTSDIGSIALHSDSTAFGAIDLADCVIRNIDPGAYDGTDPVVKLTIRGVYYINNNLWS
ncbi:MAG: hypothetical protein M0Z78_00185 [Betaproteobacteria bacterium]|nr:hypothetical protein [Betaproteobacteria bacterium]